jgi:hypothetical protein
MKALLLIDIQNGFCPGGNLPVPEGDKVVAGRQQADRQRQIRSDRRLSGLAPRRPWQLRLLPSRQETL